jgi:hypothetical protein
MISLQHEDSLLVAGVFAEFELADYKRFEEALAEQIRRHGRACVLVDLRDMLRMTVDVALEDIKFTRAHASDPGKVALLSEREGVQWLALLLQPFMNAELRVFDDEGTAREWLAD